MPFIPQSQDQWIGFGVVLISNALIEYWLGKTDKTKSGSILEALANVAKSMGNNLMKKKENQNGQP